MGRDDVQLLKDCLAGKAGAWEALLARHGPAMRRVVAARLGSEAEAEEICQKVFVKLAADGGHALRAFRGACSLQTWLLVVALGEATDHERVEARSRRRALQHPADQDRIPTPLQALCATEDAAGLQAAVEKLPYGDRLLLTLIYWDGLSQAEATRILRCPPQAVSHRLSRILSALRDCLAKR